MMGKKRTVDEIFREIEKDTVFYDNSGGVIRYREENLFFKLNFA